MVAMIHAHYALVATKIGMMARIMTTSAVYHKVQDTVLTDMPCCGSGHVHVMSCLSAHTDIEAESDYHQ